VICLNIFTVPLAPLGLWFFLVQKEGKRYRVLGWTFCRDVRAVLSGARALVLHDGAISDVAGGGSVVFGRWLDGLRPGWARFVEGLQWAGLLVGGVVFTLLLVPVAPIGSHLWRVTSRLHDQFREEIGWPELVESVARVFRVAARGGTGANRDSDRQLWRRRSAESLRAATWAATRHERHRTRSGIAVMMRGNRKPWCLWDSISRKGRSCSRSCAVAAQNVNRYLVVNEESKEHRTFCCAGIFEEDVAGVLEELQTLWLSLMLRHRARQEWRLEGERGLTFREIFQW